MKFTEQGSVTLGVRAYEQGLIFWVTDTGIGLDPAQLSRVFQKFAQGDATTTRRYGGTGLGLSISRELAERMGGRLEAVSAPGEGACFTLTLPMARAGSCPVKAASKAAQPTQVAPSDRRLKILAAEDNLTNQLVLRSLLAPLDVDLTIVGDGQAALQEVATHGFDIVLMDVQMPVMNGVDATLAIRALEASEGRPRLPILGVSANVMTHQIEDYMSAGMDGCVGKPIEIGELYAALEKALASDAAEPPAASSETSAA